MIEDLSGQLEKCYRAKDWYDLAIEAKDDVIKVGRVLLKTAQDRILALERDIALIKEKLLALDTATASLALAVGKSIPPRRKRPASEPGYGKTYMRNDSGDRGPRGGAHPR